MNSTQRPVPPGVRRVPVRCVCCKSPRLSKVNDTKKLGMDAVTVRCSICGHSWVSQSPAMIDALRGGR